MNRWISFWLQVLFWIVFLLISISCIGGVVSGSEYLGTHNGKAGDIYVVNIYYTVEHDWNLTDDVWDKVYVSDLNKSIYVEHVPIYKQCEWLSIEYNLTFFVIGVLNTTTTVDCMGLIE